MKRLIGLSLLFFFVACHSTPSTPPVSLPWNTDWQKAAEKAKAEHHSLFVAFSTEWCPYCRYAEEQTFPKPEVAKVLTNYVLLKIDGDLANSQPLMKKYKVEGYPTFIIFNPEGVEQTRFNDIYDEEDCLLRLQENNPEVLAKILKTIHLPDEYKKEFESYNSEALKQALLKKAANLIEERIKNFRTLDLKTKRITTDEHIDLLAQIYKELGQYEKIKTTYKKGARLTEQMVRRGGFTKNKYLLTTVAYYYNQAGLPEKALSFLKRALIELPDYWPIHSWMAKSYAALREWEEAMESAKKAHRLAEEVAKSKIILIMGEIYAAQKKWELAISTLLTGEKELENMHIEGGRGAKMKEKLENQQKEYEKYEKNLTLK